MSSHEAGKPLILLTGATGYVGGRLLRELEGAGRRIRCLARRPEFLRHRAADATEVTAGDVLDRNSLAAAMEGVHTAYYLVHSMGSGPSFEEEDREAAWNFGDHARLAGVRRIVYLGGLGREGQDLSTHLRSRHEVGRILRESGLPVIEFRASIVIGSGSLSFELVRALVERLPVMVAPRWVSVTAQPVAVTDLLAYLVAALEHRREGNQIYEIGGADRVTYLDLMKEYARQRDLKRKIFLVPVLTPRLSSLWLGLVTPLYARIGRALIESIRNPSVVEDPSALEHFSIRPMGVRKALEQALLREDREWAETRWSDALSASGPQRSFSGVRFGNRIVDSRTTSTSAPPAVAFQAIERIGGEQGWYYGNRLWQIRGFLDLLVGGVGMRRGRRDPDRLMPGDVVDCWRVESIEPNRRLRLFAEMKLPGRAWLEFEVEGNSGGSTIRQTAIYDPVGLSGLAYWYLLLLPHFLVFRGMIRNIAAASEQGGGKK